MARDFLGLGVRGFLILQRTREPTFVEHLLLCAGCFLIISRNPNSNFVLLVLLSPSKDEEWRHFYSGSWENTLARSGRSKQMLPCMEVFSHQTDHQALLKSVKAAGLPCATGTKAMSELRCIVKLLVILLERMSRLFEFLSFSPLVMVTLKTQQTHKGAASGPFLGTGRWSSVHPPMEAAAAASTRPALSGECGPQILFYPLDFCFYKSKNHFLCFCCSGRWMI